MDKTVMEARVRQILDGSPIRDGYLISLWSNFYAGPPVEEMERRFGVSRDDFNVLFTLAICESLTASEICMLNGRPKNSISRAVAHLTEDGCLRKQHDAHDRRKVYLTLTDIGRKRYEQVLPLFVERQDRMLSGLSRDEREVLKALLSKSMYNPDGWAEDLIWKGRHL